MSINHELFKSSNIRGFIARLPDDEDAKVRIIRFLKAYNGVYGDISAMIQRIINKVICRLLTEATMNVADDRKRQERIVAFINLIADNISPRPPRRPIIYLHTIIRAIRVNAVLVAKRLIAYRDGDSIVDTYRAIAANGTPAAFDTLRKVIHVSIENFIVCAMQNCNIPVLKRIREVYGNDAFRLFVSTHCRSLHDLLWEHRKVRERGRVAMIDYFSAVVSPDFPKWDSNMLFATLITNSLDVYDEFAARRISVNMPIPNMTVHCKAMSASHFLGLLRRGRLGIVWGEMSVSRLIASGRKIGMYMGWTHSLSCKSEDCVNGTEIVAAYTYHIRVRGINHSRSRPLADVTITIADV